MSLLDRVRACRRVDGAPRVALEVDAARVGSVDAATAAALCAGPEGFRLEAGVLTLRRDLATPEARTEAVERALRRLQGGGLLAGWRGERYAVQEAWGAPERLRVERAAAPLLGVKAFGVHVNAWVRSPAGPLLWVARRSAHKPSSPGKLDHLVAGGQPAGLTLRENLVKEAQEEAGVPAHLAARAVPGAPFRYRLSVEAGGLRDDTLFVFDLELPGDFEPRAMDGEVESFELMTPAEVLERLRRSEDFKYNVGPCILGFLLRQGLLPADEPERETLVRELAAPG